MRIFTSKGLVELSKIVGFAVETIGGVGHIFGKIGEILDRNHTRFIIIKVRKI